MDIEFQGHLGATGRHLDFFHPGPRMDPRTGRHWRREAQAIGAVVDLGGVAADLEAQRQFHPRLQHLDQRAMGDGAAERALQARPLRIGMDPVIIARQLGKGVDQCLIDQHHIAPVAELLADQGLQGRPVVEVDLPGGRLL
ncbi:hypothetical protein D3C86_1573080 [compost metagenome]